MDINLKIPAIEQLLKLTASGIGAVVGPMLVRWQARAKADALRIEAKGKADSLILISDAQVKAHDSLSVSPASTHGEIDIHNEIQARLSFQEEKRQRNIESVVGMAADELGDRQVREQDIDHDWTARFFADVQDISSEKMQQIWAKILAGEVETPGRTSMQTLSILKNMPQRDAELFQKIASFIIYDFVLKHDSTENISGFPNYSSFLRLSHHNLVHLGTGLQKIFENQPEYQIECRGVLYRFYKDSPEIFELNIPCHVLTPSGRELFELINCTKDRSYLNVLSEFLKNRGNVKLAYASIKSRSEAHWHLGPWVNVDPCTLSKRND